jgi:hypothetical protein
VGVKETKKLVMGPALVFQFRCKLDQDLVYDRKRRQFLERNNKLSNVISTS